MWRPRRSDPPRRRRAGDPDRSANERRPARRVRARGRGRGARLFPCRGLSSRGGHRRCCKGTARRVGRLARRRCGGTVESTAESDTCLVVVTVFKIVAPALRAGGWVRFPPSPPASMTSSHFRAIPSVDRVLRSLGDTGLPGPVVVDAVRRHLKTLRSRKAIPPVAAVVARHPFSLQGLRASRPRR